MVIFGIVILIFHLIASVIFEANVNPPFQGGFLLSSDNSKVDFYCRQTIARYVLSTLKTVLSALKHLARSFESRGVILLRSRKILKKQY